MEEDDVWLYRLYVCTSAMNQVDPGWFWFSELTDSPIPTSTVSTENEKKRTTVM